MKKILWIDDEIEVTDSGACILNRFGYDSIVANDYRTGIKLLKTEKPDVVITDYFMPQKTGKTLAQMIKRIDKNIRVIMCSGSLMIDQQTAKKIGIDAVLNKPFRMEELKKVIEDLS